MDHDQIKMIAKVVRDQRHSKGFTQKELAEISKISLRSIQRIEQGKVKPRMYTLKVLSKTLDFSMDFLSVVNSTQNNSKAQPSKKRLIISISSGLVFFLLAGAFLVQSASFPETTFEHLIYWAAVLILVTLFQLQVWKSN